MNRTTWLLMLAVSSWSCSGIDWWRPISSTPDASTTLACVDDYAPVVPSSRCTASLEGVQVCPAGLAGYGFECHQGCWRRFADGICNPPSGSPVCDGIAGPVTPSVACTAANQGVEVCPAGQVGYGYQCAGGCWAFFYDGPCTLSSQPPDGGDDAGYCPGPTGPVVPAYPCTADSEGLAVCPAGLAGYGYECRSGCWQLFYDGLCSPGSQPPDAGPDAGLCSGISGPVVPSFDCTASLEGSMVCPAGLSGYGYHCTQGCWSLFYDYPCAPSWGGERDAGWVDAGTGATPDAGNLCGASGPQVPDTTCTAAVEGSEVCPAGRAGYGYRCTKGCWSLFSDGPCTVSAADAGGH